MTPARYKELGATEKKPEWLESVSYQNTKYNDCDYFFWQHKKRICRVPQVLQLLRNERCIEGLSFILLFRVLECIKYYSKSLLKSLNKLLAFGFNIFVIIYGYFYLYCIMRRLCNGIRFIVSNYFRIWRLKVYLLSTYNTKNDLPKM